MSSSELYSVDQELLKDYIKRQIEYYFSVDNLQRDFFLRRKMDSEGFLPIGLIASFHRVQALTTDIGLIVKALRDSKVVEIIDEKIRRKEHPDAWPLPGPSPADASQTDFSQLINCPEFVPRQGYQKETESAPGSPRTSSPTMATKTEEKPEDVKQPAPQTSPAPVTTPKPPKEQDEPEELDFMFDEEMEQMDGRKNTFTDWSDEDSDYEIDDRDVNKILIVTQTPPSLRKHPGGDRTGNHTSRVKMSSEWASSTHSGYSSLSSSVCSYKDHSLCNTQVVISEAEVIRILKGLKVKKAPGPDGVSPMCLKVCATQLAPILTNIYNVSLKECVVPQCWKNSTIIPVPKKVGSSELNDYRPVKCNFPLVIKFSIFQTSIPHMIPPIPKRSYTIRTICGIFHG
ncbi:la-related protein 1-like [Dendrobates tinctorius]|uniref:la-related protein 1-like n=1 Tax=Dendrobates tinctorius TaxID=92724 RepID=UPI003CC928A1